MKSKLIVLGIIPFIFFFTCKSAASLGFPLVIELRGEGEPVVGEKFSLRVEFFSGFDLEDIMIEVHLPEGLKRRAGELRWCGDLKKMKRESFIIEAEATEPGEFKIKAVGAAAESINTAEKWGKRIERIFVISDLNEGSFDHSSSSDGINYSSYSSNAVKVK